MGWSGVFLLIGITSLAPSPAEAIECYECDTTWDMGCWYKWKTPQSGVDPKHLQFCTGASYCVKETFQDPYFSQKNKIHGFSPYVRRRCGNSGDEAEATGVTQWQECRKTPIKLSVDNATLLEIDKTVCSCSIDACNIAHQLFAFPWTTMVGLLCSGLA